MKLEVELPITAMCSKNEKYIGRYDKILSHKYSNRRKRLTEYLKSLIEKNKLKYADKKKIWVKIYIFRPDFKSDPINISEFTNDAIKNAIGVDDRYFSEVIDWELDRKRPRIKLTIEQD